MNNASLSALRTRDYYKGKSFDFAGEWKATARYFNDEFLTTFVVYHERAGDTIVGSALLGCKKSHVAAYDKAVRSSTDNQPHLKINNGDVVGIKPNDYWIFICGSLKGQTGENSSVVETYTEAVSQATAENKGKLLYVIESQEEFIVIDEGKLERVVIGNEVEQLAKKKVDKVDGKQLSTEDYTTEEKGKLEGIEEGAQVNVLEGIRVNGAKIEVTDKVADITISTKSYTIDKLATPEGNYLASYVLRENGARTGSTINIPKDKAIYSGSVEVVTAKGYPFSGALVGDKYIDILLNDTEKTHIYIPAQKLVDAYSGDKYVKVDTDNKVINLDYNQLKSDLNNDLSIGVAQISGLEDRLKNLESDDSKVVKIGTTNRMLTGTVTLDSRDFSIDSVTNMVRLNFNSADFDTSGMAEQVRADLLGQKNDVLDYDLNSTDGLSLYGVKNALIEINNKDYLTKDQVGDGLTWNPEEKMTINIKDNSAIQINDKGELILTWS